MIVEFNWDWKTFLEQAKPDIPEIKKVTMDDIRGLKPKWITTYCGCVCVEVNPKGGKFELCKLHEEKFEQPGEVRIPKVQCDIPVTWWESLKMMVRK